MMPMGAVIENMEKAVRASTEPNLQAEGSGSRQRAVSVAWIWGCFPPTSDLEEPRPGSQDAGFLALLSQDQFSHLPRYCPARLPLQSHLKISGERTTVSNIIRLSVSSRSSCKNIYSKTIQNTIQEDL